MTGLEVTPEPEPAAPTMLEICKVELLADGCVLIVPTDERIQPVVVGSGLVVLPASAESTPTVRQPDGYMYRFGDGAVRMDSHERNGGGVTAVIPYWLTPQPYQASAVNITCSQPPICATHNCAMQLVTARFSRRAGVGTFRDAAFQTNGGTQHRSSSVSPDRVWKESYSG